MATTIFTSSKDQYLELVHQFPLRPIRTRSAHKVAKETLRSLVGQRGQAVRDYKIVLASLIVEYERLSELRFDTSHVTAGDVVLHLLNERDMSVNAFAKVVKVSQSSLSNMINGRREWSKAAIVAVSHFFGLRAELFLR